MNKFGSVGKKASSESNEKIVTDDNGNINLQEKRIVNLGDAKADQDAISLRSMTIILNQFKEQITAEQVAINQYFSKDINRLTAIDDSPDNSLVRNKDKGLFVKQTLGVTEKEIDARNKVITNVQTPRNKNDAVNLGTLITYLLDFDKKLENQQTFSNSLETKIADQQTHINNIERAVVNIIKTLRDQKPIDQPFVSKMEKIMAGKHKK